MAFRFDHLDDDEKRDGGHDVQKSGEPFEHVARMHERVEGEGRGNDYHDDDDDDEGHFGADEVATFGAVLPQEVMVVLAYGFVEAVEEIAATPEAGMAPQEDAVVAVGVVQSESVVCRLGLVISQVQVGFFFAERFVQQFNNLKSSKMYFKKYFFITVALHLSLKKEIIWKANFYETTV